MRLETEVASLDGVEGDAIVVATGEGGNTFGLLEGVDRQSFGTMQPGKFVVGNLLGTTPVEDIAQGRIAAFSAEKYLKVGAMDGMPETLGQTQCALVTDLAGVRSEGRCSGSRGTYDEKAASAEAERCLLCDCTFCSDGCELFGAFRKMPKQMVSEAMASLHAKTSKGATRVMSSCNLSVACAERSVRRGSTWGASIGTSVYSSKKTACFLRRFMTSSCATCSLPTKKLIWRAPASDVRRPATCSFPAASWRRAIRDMWSSRTITFCNTSLIWR